MPELQKLSSSDVYALHGFIVEADEMGILRDEISAARAWRLDDYLIAQARAYPQQEPTMPPERRPLRVSEEDARLLLACARRVIPHLEEWEEIEIRMGIPVERAHELLDLLEQQEA